MTDYQAPKWGLCGQNVHNISLEAIKAGSVIDEISFPKYKSYQIAGRMKEGCDVHFNHPSISRTHAVFQFDEQGKLFLMDLKSTHGTFLNKKRIHPGKFYALNVGDLLRFGDSTRLYAICGPSELLPNELGRAQKGKVNNAKQVKGDDCATWGFGEDAVEEEESDNSDVCETDKPDKTLSFFAHFGKLQEEREQESTPSDMNEKEKRDWQGIQRRRLKKQHLQQEIDRIQAKQFQLNGGLTTGQVQAMERNESYIQRLDKEIEELEAKLRVKRDQKTHQRLRQDNEDLSDTRISIKRTEYDSDEDDYYDRTMTNQRIDPVRSDRSLQSMPLTSTDIQRNIMQLQKSLSIVEEQRRTYLDQDRSADCDGETEAVDALDAYMNLTKKKMESDNLENLRQKELEIEQKLDQQRRLLSIATPAIASITISAPEEKQDSPVKTINVTAVSLNSVEKQQQSDVPEATATKKRSITELEPHVMRNEKKKTQRIAQRSNKTIGPKLPQNVQIPKAQSIPSSNGVDHLPLKPFQVLEGGEAIWLPPSDQTGNGRTKLNEKYGY
uniref:Uncharacterized protein AlNc14C24G2400 n=1 Tax=Albugo laibachii Nc14 TaxID=890382 RepID=F0W6A0_9STRA|nr:conserved hypothetical protein [Albugo laibachii Nc14]|eukprot:CCA16643.1 conserved hypothetical protein [Albugo laibachii Nc14]